MAIIKVVKRSGKQIAKKANTGLEKERIFEIVKVNEELGKLWQSLKS